MRSCSASGSFAASANEYAELMTISLSEEQQQLVRELVDSGRNKSEADVVEQSIGLLQEYESPLAELRAEVQKGIDSGEPTPLVMRDVKAKARRSRDQ